MKKSLPILLSATFIFAITSCGSKKSKEEKKETEPIFPVLSFIKGQISHIDTSFYQIMELVVVDSTRTDTNYIAREQVHALAADFLNIPDLEQKEFQDRYKQEKIMDETINRVMIIYTAIDPTKELIKRQELQVTPDPETGVSKVHNIIIDYEKDYKDSVITRKLMWQADKSFQVTIFKQVPGQPEQIVTRKITWNENPQQ